MTLVRKIILVLFSLLILGAGLVGAQENTQQSLNQFVAVVIKVVDGDTIWVKDQQGLKHKLRLANIDAPELNQAYGQTSSIFLNQLIYGENVDVTVITKDRYKREVAIVVYKKQDVNLMQIENGMAWHYISIAKKQQAPAEYQRYAIAQQYAQQKNLGLWKKDNAMAPWEFRRVASKQ